MKTPATILLTTGIILVFALLLSPSAPAAEIKDAESATHAGDAAQYQIVDTYKYPDFQVVQITLPVLSHYSYVLISGNEGLLVDPGRDFLASFAPLREWGVQIKGVFLTHSHADFVAGHMEVAHRVGCPIYVNAKAGAEYPHEALSEGSTLRIGSAHLTFIETPGHTPDGLCALVAGASKKDSPLVIFTGDTLFVGSVGRPDLLEGKVSAASLASMMFDTWTEKLLKLDDVIVAFPAHGAGSLCGANLSDKPFSTIGAERASNPYLQHTRRSEFIAAVISDLPEAPQYFKYNAAMNRKGPELIDWAAPPPPQLAAAQALADPALNYVVDLRDAQQYAAGHIENSVNIGLRGRLETWAGIMVPWEAKLALCGSDREVSEALHRLHRVGYRAEWITMESWTKAGLLVAASSLVQPAELHKEMQEGTAPVVVDVRLPNEWMGTRIGTVANLPLNHLSELAAKLDAAQPVVTVCNSAYRSSMAVGILERRGFKSISSLAGGTEAWLAAGLPLYGAEAQKGGAAAAPAAAKRALNLPDRISPDDLNRLLKDLPDTFDLVDIRPPDQFADYSIPGSRSVDIAELMSNPAHLTGAADLIVVDRDGSLAMAVAGILSQKTPRRIRVLHGGVEAYWAAMELQGAVREVPIAPSGGIRGAPGLPSVAPAPSLLPAPAAPGAPQTPKKKSAGC